jgi:rhodanese-related sulfurtransferase
MEPAIQPLKYCGCASPTEKCPDAPRSLKAAELDPDATLVFDVRREADYAASGETLPGAMWKNPEKIDVWIGALPRTLDVVIYCMHGGEVSNSVVDRLQAEGVKARFIEGGIEAWKAAGGKTAAKKSPGRPADIG